MKTRPTRVSGRNLKVFQLNFLTFLDSLLNIKNNKDKVQLFAPIWLEEIQSNKIYKKYSERNQKIEEDKTQEIKTESTEPSDAVKVDAMETEPKESGDQNTNQTEEKENSRTESDQDC